MNKWITVTKSGHFHIHERRLFKIRTVGNDSFPCSLDILLLLIVGEITLIDNCYIVVWDLFKELSCAVLVKDTTEYFVLFKNSIQWLFQLINIQIISRQFNITPCYKRFFWGIIIISGVTIWLLKVSKCKWRIFITALSYQGLIGHFTTRSKAIIFQNKFFKIDCIGIFIKFRQCDLYAMLFQRRYDRYRFQWIRSCSEYICICT